MIFITGGAGFIGSNFVIDWLANCDESVVNIDKLSYAGNMDNLSEIKKNSKHIFIHGDIANSNLIINLLQKYQPRAIINFAAETHVDRSINSPEVFIQTNIVGTYKLLESTLKYFNSIDKTKQNYFRFLHISTDEVYGSLEKNAPPFNELNRYEPNSPYSASKASSDHLVRSYHHTYNLPVLITNCSNNYGPYQFPEKLIPLCIHNAISGKHLPIYGNGQQIRDWLYVKDHCCAIRKVLQNGSIGNVYIIGGNCEKSNVETVNLLCSILDELRPRKDRISYTKQIAFVADRLGHDKRYAMDINKISAQLGWQPKETFETGLRKTVIWYLQNNSWIENVTNVTSGKYLEWIKNHYDQLKN